MYNCNLSVGTINDHRKNIKYIINYNVLASE